MYTPHGGTRGLYLPSCPRGQAETKKFLDLGGLDAGPFDDGRQSETVQDVEGSAAVKVDTTLEKLMPHFGQRMTPVAVAGDDGTVIGQVSAQDVLSALATAEDESP